MQLTGGRFDQAAALPYREVGSGMQVLLVTSRETRRWIIPKGNLEPGLTASEAAAMEAFEEAGVSGEVDVRSIGHYRYAKSGRAGSRSCQVEVFPLRVCREHVDWLERRERTRRWMTIAEAVTAVKEPELKRIIGLFGIRMTLRRWRERQWASIVF